MAVRASSLAGRGTTPIGGPAGTPGQSTYAAWLALGNTGTLADFMAAQKGRDGLLRSVGGVSKPDVAIADLAASDIQAQAGTSEAALMTPGRTALQIAASIASGPIGAAFSNKAVPAAPSAVPRTYLDRFGDNVVAHDLSDGSGAAANDDAALNAAFAAAQAAGFNSQGFLRPVLLTRPFNVTSQHAVPAGMRVYSTTQNASLIARAASGSMLNITGGRTRVEGLLFQNPSLLTVTPITVNKPHNDYTVGLKRLDFGNFPIAIDWILGDRPDFEDVYGVSVGLLMRFQADAQNGHIVRPKVFGGNLLSISKASGARVPDGGHDLRGGERHPGAGHLRRRGPERTGHPDHAGAGPPLPVHDDRPGHDRRCGAYRRLGIRNGR